MKNIVITGGSFGLGSKIIEQLILFNNFEIDTGQFDIKIYNFDTDYVDYDSPKFDHYNGMVEYVQCDITDYLEMQECSEYIGDKGGCDILINCAGINSINYLNKVLPEDFDKLMNTNARSIMYTAQNFLRQLTNKKGTILNIISNASHMPMTNSLAYNASKGAAHIMTLQLARELTKANGITVFGISPNKLAGTIMSKYIDKTVPKIRNWTSEEAKQYQLSALLTGEETDPRQLAEFIAYILSDKKRHKFLSGCVIPYGA